MALASHRSKEVKYLYEKPNFPAVPTLPEPYAGTEPYAFISYSHNDKQQVHLIMHQMYLRGVRFWYDKGIEKGDEWRRVIYQQVEGCRAFVSFISKASLDSRWCCKEIERAYDNKKPIIFIFLEDCKPDEEINGYLADNQGYPDFYKSSDDRETFFSSFLRAQCIRDCIGPVPENRHEGTSIVFSLVEGIHAILAFDLMKFKYPDKLAETITSVLRKQEDLANLCDETVSARTELLHPEAFNSIRVGEHIAVGYNLGRIISVAVDTPLPESDPAARKEYFRDFCDVLDALFLALHKNGVTVLHVFYRGPLAPFALFSQQAERQGIRVYHYGKYTIEATAETRYYLIGRQAAE